MALVKCVECSAEVSSLAEACPRCGFPVGGLPSKATHPDAAASPLSDQKVAILLSQKKETNHILHLLLSVFTGGLWLIVWLIVADANRRHNKRIVEGIALGVETGLGDQRQRLYQLAVAATKSKSKRRQQWGRETLERMNEEKDEG